MGREIRNFGRDRCGAQLSISAEKAQRASDEIGRISENEEVFLAQMHKLVGKSNFAQTSVMGKVGRAALRPVYDLLTRGGGKVDKKGRVGPRIVGGVATENGPLDTEAKEARG